MPIDLGAGAAGAASGAAAGSVIPGVGTAVGAVVGGLIGLFGGPKKPKVKKSKYVGDVNYRVDPRLSSALDRSISFGDVLGGRSEDLYKQGLSFISGDNAVVRQQQQQLRGSLMDQAALSSQLGGRNLAAQGYSGGIASQLKQIRRTDALEQYKQGNLGLLAQAQQTGMGLLGASGQLNTTLAGVLQSQGSLAAGIDTRKLGTQLSNQATAQSVRNLNAGFQNQANMQYADSRNSFVNSLLSVGSSALANIGSNAPANKGDYS